MNPHESKSLNLVYIPFADFGRAGEEALPKIAAYFSAQGAVEVGRDHFLVPGDFDRLTVWLGSCVPASAMRRLRVYSLSAFAPGANEFDRLIRERCRAHFAEELKLHARV